MQLTGTPSGGLPTAGSPEGAPARREPGPDSGGEGKLQVAAARRRSTERRVAAAREAGVAQAGAGAVGGAGAAAAVRRAILSLTRSCNCPSCVLRRTAACPWARGLATWEGTSASPGHHGTDGAMRFPVLGWRPFLRKRSCWARPPAAVGGVGPGQGAASPAPRVAAYAPQLRHQKVLPERISRCDRCLPEMGRGSVVAVPPPEARRHHLAARRVAT